MEIKTTETIEKMVNIDLPYYVKGSCHAYKVINETTCIQVTHSHRVQAAICETYVSLAFSCALDTPCTEAEYQELFDLTLNRILDANN